MNTAQFFDQLEATIARHDLLCHPFYRAWAAGELTRDDLREYARHYYHHVQAFPCYLAEFALRLDEGELRRAVLANMCDEKGVAAGPGRDSVPHSELWLDFAEGMGRHEQPYSSPCLGGALSRRHQAGHGAGQASPEAAAPSDVRTRP